MLRTYYETKGNREQEIGVKERERVMKTAKVN